jgi:hypothetical protein
MFLLLSGRCAGIIIAGKPFLGRRNGMRRSLLFSPAVQPSGQSDSASVIAEQTVLRLSTLSIQRLYLCILGLTSRLRAL